MLVFSEWLSAKGMERQMLVFSLFLVIPGHDGSLITEAVGGAGIIFFGRTKSTLLLLNAGSTIISLK